MSYRVHPYPALPVSTICRDPIRNQQGQYLGTIQELMVDTESGRVAYAVLAGGGRSELGDQLLAIPWGLFEIDLVNRRFYLNVDREQLARAESFDKNDWPDMSDPNFAKRIHQYYGAPLGPPRG